MSNLPTNAEAWSNVAANAAQVVAIVIGGIWAYLRFFRQREDRPRATLALTATHRSLNRRRIWFRLDLRVENTGPVLLPLASVRADLLQVQPLVKEDKAAIKEGRLIPRDSHEAEWTCIGHHEKVWAEGESELEPGETDHVGFDFLIPRAVKTVFVYCYLPNALKPDRTIGWTATAVYDLNQTGVDSGQRKLSEAI